MLGSLWHKSTVFACALPSTLVGATLPPRLDDARIRASRRLRPQMDKSAMLGPVQARANSTWHARPNVFPSRAGAHSQSLDVDTTTDAAEINTAVYSAESRRSRKRLGFERQPPSGRLSRRCFRATRSVPRRRLLMLGLLCAPVISLRINDSCCWSRRR